MDKSHILLYHGVTKSNSEGIENISGKHMEAMEFDKQMKWLSENKNNINSEKLKKISRKISLRKLLHFKFNEDYKNCLTLFKKNFKSIIVFKMLIIVFTPLYILKKISWFHN